MRIIIASLVFCVFIAGCATPLTPVSNTPALLPTDITPVQAILAAAEKPVTGSFFINIKATGRDKYDILYLNSELDYRDQRCLTIEIPSTVADDLRKKYGAAPEVYLKGKTIRVSGTAERVTIYFFANGIRTDKYYYQTHVAVSSAAQLSVLQ